MGITVVRGRDISAADRADAPLVAVVDERFVERFFPEGEPLGQRIVVRDAPRTIVGVVSSVRHRRIGVIDGPTATVYLPYAQNPTSAMAFLVSGPLDATSTFDALRAAVWSVDSELPVAGLMTIDDYIALQMRGIDVFAGIVGGFALFAVVLAGLGVYDVLAYSVAQRRQEIGVRMAMGARRREVVALVLRQGLRLTGSAGARRTTGLRRAPSRQRHARPALRSAGAHASGGGCGARRRDSAGQPAPRPTGLGPGADARAAARLRAALAASRPGRLGL